MTDNKFTKSTKLILAQRAGYMCSLCGKLTVGPSSETEYSVALLGDAAHIASAEPGGKRYDEKMSPKERKDISNGIWLCKDHHKLVDSDQGSYTKEFLNTIKENHEKRISFLNSGISLDTGLVVRIQVENIGNFNKKENIEFSNSTLIFGNNATGKTLICDMIASLQHPEKINKWKGRRNQGSSNYTISYFDSNLSEYRINYSSKNKVSFAYNERTVPAIISPYHCLYIEKDYFDVTREIETVISSIAHYFSINEEEVIELINFTNKLEKAFINEIFFEEDELMVKMDPESPTLPFLCLSTGEQYRVIIELSFRLAEYYSLFRPTILIIEYSAITVVDVRGINSLLTWVKNKKKNYQFVFSSHRPHTSYDTTGHRTYLLELINGSTDVKLIN